MGYAGARLEQHAHQGSDLVCPRRPPAEPGYRSVRIAPRLGRLREVAGAVPTTHGYVEVRVAGSEAEIDSPVPINVASEDGAETELAAGQHRATIR
jgi:alpha-L-rhamnosidase